MKKWIIIIVLILLVSGLGIYLYYGKEDKNTTLTASDRQWIDNNKNNVIDISIPSDIPVLSNNGEGLIFDFFDDFENTTGLELNKLSYTKTEKPTSSYALKQTNQKTKDEILIYQDNYMLVSNTNIKYSSPYDIKNIVIGTLQDDNAKIKKYLLGSTEITYKSYEDTASMFKDLNNQVVDVIAVPRLANLDKVISSKNLYIAYNITEFSIDYVLTLGTNNTFNKILNKYYLNWSNKHMIEDFNKNLVNNYFASKKIDEKDQTIFRSKRYSYAFVDNSPFDITTKDGLKGFNYSLLKEFSTAANIEIDYKKYSNFETLTKEFGENKVDIIFNYTNKNNYNMDTYNTVSPYNEEIVIIADQNTDLVINSINSLVDQTIYTIKNTKIQNYLNEHGIKTKTYNNIDELVKNIEKNDLAVIDYYNYDYYIRTDLSKFKNLLTLKLDDEYSFISRDINANKTFNELFNFYLSFEDTNKIINNSYKELLNYNTSNKLFRNLIILFSSMLLVIIGIIIGKQLKKRNKPNVKLSKSDKLRYVDNLTSLKNRNYLNDNAKVWENSDIYPQAIIIIDLNNIAYINDNFGHAEGDKVIVEGASILIKNQLPNSEIIRTDGNEFLIFVLNQDEKKIITYIRKLRKEFKSLSHGFEAAIGYSIITDEVKTIDDAVNEATLDMRSNKEEVK